MSNVKTSKLNRRKWQQIREVNHSMIEKISDEVGIENLVEKVTMECVGEEYLVFDKTLKLEQCAHFSQPGVTCWNVYIHKTGGYKLSTEWQYVGTLPEGDLVKMLWHSYYGASSAETAIELC